MNHTIEQFDKLDIDRTDEGILLTQYSDGETDGIFIPHWALDYVLGEIRKVADE